MTIKKGEAWGTPASPPDDAVIVASDRALSLALESARHDGAPFPSFVVSEGDLGHTLGATGSPHNAFPIDVGELLLDGRHHYFVAHVVARTKSWRSFAVAMNAQWLGEWNLGPKAHPNDGLIDAYEASLGLFDWPKVRARLPTGSHLPHPRIHQTRAKAVTLELPRLMPVAIDGDPVGAGKVLVVRVIPDAITVYA